MPARVQRRSGSRLGTFTKERFHRGDPRWISEIAESEIATEAGFFLSPGATNHPRESRRIVSSLFRRRASRSVSPLARVRQTIPLDNRPVRLSGVAFDDFADVARTVLVAKVRVIVRLEIYHGSRVARAKPRNVFDALNCIKVAAKAVRAHLMGYELWSFAVLDVSSPSFAPALRAFLFTLLMLLFPSMPFFFALSFIRLCTPFYPWLVLFDDAPTVSSFSSTEEGFVHSFRDKAAFTGALRQSDA